MTDTRLKELMRELFVAEVHKAGADVSKVLVNAEEKAPDDGCDGYTPAGTEGNVWLTDRETCWQFKTRSAGQPKRLKGEVLKAIPMQTLRAGGRFVLVAPGAKAGEAGVRDRLKVLAPEAKKVRLPVNRIHVLTAESLCTWVNQWPAIAARLRDMPGFSTLDEWKRDRQHREAWVDTPDTKSKIEQVRRDLDPGTDGTIHLHVFGRPGVGKTRFVLEACRGASWAPTVLYLPQFDGTRVYDLLTAAVRAPQVQMVLVVDEVPQDRVANLALPAQHAGSRVRLISIGHDRSPEPGRVDEVRVDPLEEPVVEGIVQTWYPTMPAEHTNYVARVSDGFMKLARILADAIATTPTANTHELFARNDVQNLMERMLGNENERRALHVVAVLASVGWAGDKAAEGEAIANHFELSWVEVKAMVHRFHQRLGIAPLAGDLRYVSPVPLGVYLAIDAWAIYPEKLRSLPSVLSADGNRAFNDRLRAIAASPQAKAFAEEELKRFFRWDHWSNAGAAARWSALSGAHPGLAAAQARGAFEQATADELFEIGDRARREVVNGLVALAWYPEAFDHAVTALHLLGVAENERWANNAAGEFANRFQLILGGTSVPYRDRLSVIDEITRQDNPKSIALVLSALVKIGDTYGSRMEGAAPSGGPRVREWHPENGVEYVASIQAALGRLEPLASRDGVDQDLVKAVHRVSMLLREPLFRDYVASFVRAIVKSHPSLREPVRREVQRIVESEKKYWKDLPSEDVAWLDRLHRDLEDHSLAGQFRQLLSEPDLELREQALMPLAEQIVKDPSTMWREWEWLTSGQLGTGWDFGVALSRLEAGQGLLGSMVDASPRGSDLRVICGYVFEHARSKPEGWVDDWLDSVEKTRPHDIQLLFEATWRCAPTARGAERLIRFAKQGKLSESMVGQMPYGSRAMSMSLASFNTLNDILVRTPGFRSHVLTMVESRIETETGALNELKSLALTLVTDNAIIVDDHMTGYYWNRLASRIVKEFAKEIAGAIFAAHADYERRRWFVQHSLASGALSMAADTDPVGVWETLKPYITDRLTSARFAVGFSEGLLDSLPHELILSWIQQAPEWRAPLVAEMTASNLDDTSIGAKVLERYGRVKGVDSTYFSAYISGSWAGPASEHWKQVALRMREVANKTVLPGVRRWALKTADELDRMSARDLKREEEERVRGYW